MHGELLAVLDLSCEARPFGFDAASVVQLYATTIENRLLHAQAAQQLQMRFQAQPRGWPGSGVPNAAPFGAADASVAASEQIRDAEAQA